MILCRVESAVVSTAKNELLNGHKILSCRPVDLDGQRPLGPVFLALDRVQAGEGDLVLCIVEGSSARLVFQSDKIPIVAFTIAVVDDIAIEDEAALVGCSVAENAGENSGGSEA